MDLKLSDIILGPIITSKANVLNKNLGKVVLEVHPQSNQVQIKAAFEKFFNAKVKKVNVSNRQKARKAGRKIVMGKLRKKAIITLAPGYSLDLLGTGGPQTGNVAEGKAE